MSRIKRKIVAAIAILSMTMLLSACAEESIAEISAENGDGSQTAQTSENRIEEDSSVSEEAEEAVTLTSEFDPEIWEILPEIPITDQSEFKYEVEGEGAVITDYLGDSTEVRIPDAVISKYSGVLPVVGVDLRDCKKEITELIMPNNIDSWSLSSEISDSLQYLNFPAVGGYVYNSPNLLAVYIPEGVEKIKYSTFAYCDGLTSIIVPKSVASIGAAAFAYCENLTSVEIRGDAVLENGVFFGSTALNVTLSDSTTQINKAAFGNKYITVTYKGNTYDYDHLDDLCEAINGEN